ncbi:MAG: hypothetical protein WCA26_04220 [Xanthobacteraceae bacterium]|jgi:hypothetical protein
MAVHRGKRCDGGDIEPSYSITSFAEASRLDANAIPSAFAALEIDDDPKPHVQQRSPGVIFRFEALGWSTGPLQSFANWGNVLAVQTAIGSNVLLGRNAHGNN